jgi:hypothetical protein
MSTRNVDAGAGGATRRDFLRVTGWGLLGMALPRLQPRATDTPPSTQLGRILEDRADVYAAPSFSARHIKTLWRDEVHPVLSATVGDPLSPANRVWYEIGDLGFVHSSLIQPVLAVLNQPISKLHFQGALAEVTLPFVEAFWEPAKDADHAYRFYYESTHWVDGISYDRKDRAWYRLYDDRIAQHYYVMAEGLRIVPVAELTPISPQIPAEAKRIEVSLPGQWVKCYEGETLVYTAVVSTGSLLADGDYWTPPGIYKTFRKRGSRHMAAGNLATGYDLPGVPWVSYITQEGISFHGTYWHNDYGTPRSHGCINMAPAGAKWIYRWTHPVVPSHLDDLWTGGGTTVHIFR